MPKIAVVQHPPVLLDREATLERAVGLTEEAAKADAEVVVFPEAFIPGYPTWIWRLRPGGDIGLTGELHQRLLANSVDLAAGELQPLLDAARRHGVWLLCGVNEREGQFSRGTLYNTYLTIGSDGEVRNRHRKLMPTNPERMVWGFGDGSGLRVIDTPCGRIGALVCWESYMPLARFAMYAQGVEVYVAPTWDSGDEWIGTMQHIAREGRCWVVSSGTSLRASDIPADMPRRDELYPDGDEWVNGGDSVVVEPGGKLVAGPLRREHGVLYVDVDPAKVGVARRSLDVAGHYARPDIFQLTVHDGEQPPIRFTRQGDAGPPTAPNTAVAKSSAGPPE